MKLAEGGLQLDLERVPATEADRIRLQIENIYVVVEKTRDLNSKVFDSATCDLARAGHKEVNDGLLLTLHLAASLMKALPKDAQRNVH